VRWNDNNNSRERERESVSTTNHFPLQKKQVNSHQTKRRKKNKNIRTEATEHADLIFISASEATQKIKRYIQTRVMRFQARHSGIQSHRPTLAEASHANFSRIDRIRNSGLFGSCSSFHDANDR
jgi:hypothetical protein